MTVVELGIQALSDLRKGGNWGMANTFSCSVWELCGRGNLIDVFKGKVTQPDICVLKQVLKYFFCVTQEEGS